MQLEVKVILRLDPTEWIQLKVVQCLDPISDLTMSGHVLKWLTDQRVPYQFDYGYNGSD